MHRRHASVLAAAVLVLAILMFIGSPAWIGLLVLATIALVALRGLGVLFEDSPPEMLEAYLTHVAHEIRHMLAGLGLRSLDEAIGRTDLPGGSMQKILRSLHDTVLALPDETVVVPGHGPLTTIGEERETNPFLIKP